MIGHLGLNVADLAASKAYYDRFMPLLGFEPFLADHDQFAYRPVGGKPGTYLFFYPADPVAAADQQRTAPPLRTGLQHLAFMVPTRPTVHQVCELARSCGSPILHEPQVFPQYPQPYYATFWLDPNGFMLEAVCHKPPRE